ncbi:MAG: peptidase domain-containing ABC transporter [Chitinophagaceae bacterium]|nr:peptidase domain-containing ABC transporter [Chitinophagaceae bacterium]
MSKRFVFYRQYDEMDCGPTCLKMICQYYGKTFSLEYLRSLSYTSREGSSMLGISNAAEKIGFKTIGAKARYTDLVKANPVPFICFWRQKHFVVVHRITEKKVFVADPAHGMLKYSKEEFLKGWSLDGTAGIVLLVEPTPVFTETKSEKPERENKFAIVIAHVRKYRRIVLQLILGLICASIFQLIFPFLTQSIVDVGIRQNNLKVIYLILLGQLFLFLGRTSIELVRSYLLLHLSSRVNITLLTSFFSKLMSLPLSFYDSKMTGDILQRISDHQRVENLLTGGVLNATFASINLVVFSIVLGLYNYKILLVFLAGSILYFFWIKLFAKKRADLDYKKFNEMASVNEKNVELIHGMQEIKLCNAERKKKWEWEHIQVKLFKIQLSSLSLKQLQIDGASVINELKNIFITFLSAKLVVEGQISLGMMLAISYIIGQLNGPIVSLTEFIQHFQDSQLSLERINEIHKRKGEEESGPAETLTEIPAGEDIKIDSLSFKYSFSATSQFVLKDLNMVVRNRKVTAIVGASGSGKTTLLKLLLKFYQPQEGMINLGNTPLVNFSHSAWRDKCGVVMQEGYIFNDTIAGNIAVGVEMIDMKKLHEAARLANIREFIEGLPLKYNTKIGSSGLGISTGQKQRILIARAIYKDPDFLFFDEATSALDATNEKEIMENLGQFFKGKTVVIIAHRLSTVRDADHIVVLDQGRLVESGNHEELIALKAAYFHLIKNQLELGN